MSSLEKGKERMLGETKEIEDMMGIRSKGRGSIVNDLIRLEKSPEMEGAPENILIVMDGLEEFTIEPLKWVLENVVLMACCSITIVGIMPWLNIPLLLKAWSGVWELDIKELLSATEKNEWKNDMKYQIVQQLTDICLKYGVIPQMKRECGFPPRGVVINEITSNRPTLVVFDRHHDSRDIEYYEDHVPCIMVRMNEEGEMELIKGKSQLQEDDINTPATSTMSMPPTPRVMIHQTWKKILKLTARGRAR